MMRSYNLTDSELALGENVTSEEWRATYQASAPVGGRDRRPGCLAGSPRSVTAGAGTLAGAGTHTPADTVGEAGA